MESPYAQYSKLFQHFGITELPTEDIPGLDSVLRQLQELCDSMPEASTSAIINWADVLFAEEGIDINTVLSAGNRRLNFLANNANKTAAYVYLGLNCVGFILSLAALQHWNMHFLATDKVSSINGSNWNYVETTGGILTAARQLHQGDIGSGLANLAASMQLAGCTVTANIAKYTTLLNASAATISALMGFSFAACMFFNCVIELCEAGKADKRIEQLEHLDQTPTIRKALLVEYARRENHLRNAKSWGACGIAMLAVAVISYVTLSGLTFGALPIATVVVTGAAFLTGIIRKWWVSREDNIKKLKSALRENKTLLDDIERIVIQHPRFKDKITIRESVLFNTTISFKEYLEKLFINDPEKLATVLKKLDRASNYNNLTSDDLGGSLGKKIIIAYGDPSADYRHDTTFRLGGG